MDNNQQIVPKDVLKVTPPASKKEVIEAMVQRKLQLIKQEHDAAQQRLDAAVKEFRVVTTKTWESYVRSERFVSDALDQPNNPLQMSWSWPAFPREVGASKHMTLPEDFAVELMPLAKKIWDASSAVGKAVRVCESMTAAKIREQIRGHAAGNAGNRVSAILADAESVSALDGVLNAIFPEIKKCESEATTPKS